MSKIKINFIVDNNPLYSKKIESSEKLSSLRSKLNISDNLYFQTNDGYDILKEDEEDYTVEDSLINNNQIVLKKKEEEKKQKELNIPIKESKFINTKNNLKLYLCPIN